MTDKLDFRLEQRLGCTDRGELWLARRQNAAPCLVRILDYRIADSEFRSAVAALMAELAAKRLPRVLPILDHGRAGDHYFIQYQLETPVRTLARHFVGTHWLARLHFVHDLLVLGRGWSEHLPQPIGFHGGRVVACQLGGQWLAHLAPCPTTLLRSPKDLIDADPGVLAAIAPERLRGVPEGGVFEDAFSAGILVLEALGQKPAPDLSPESRLEAQARAVLVKPGFPTTDVEAELWRIPPAADRLTRLEKVVERCIAFSAVARPVDLHELESACAVALELENAQTVAEGLERQGWPDEALRILEWSFAHQPENRDALRAAIDLCRKLDRPSGELRHVERLLRCDPRDRRLARRRLELRYDAYVARTEPVSPRNDPEGDWLLEELRRLRPSDEWQLEGEERQTAKQDWLRSAMINWRRGDLHRRAADLFEITKLEPNEPGALYLYGLSLRDLAADAKGEEVRQISRSVDQLLTVVQHRLEQLQKAELIEEDEKDTWAKLFQSLRLS